MAKRDGDNVHSGMLLRDALPIAYRLGFTQIENPRRSGGEVRVWYPDKSKLLNINARKKQAPGALVAAIRKFLK